MTSVTIHAEQKTTWNIGVEGMPDGLDLDLQNVLLSPDVVKAKTSPFRATLWMWPYTFARETLSMDYLHPEKNLSTALN